MSNEPIVIVRFPAAEVLALVDLARENRMDELWLVCGNQCLLQLPDCADDLEPEAIEGDESLVIEKDCKFPRVEVIELHNYVISKLVAMAGNVPSNMKLEIRFNDVEEFCLALCRWRKPCVSSHGPRFLSDAFGDI